MNALLVLFADRLAGEVFEPLPGGKNSFTLALERAGRFPGVEKTVLLTGAGVTFSDLPPGIQREDRVSWTKGELVRTLAVLSAGFDCVYFAWADCPFLDPALAGAVAQRHIRYAADYSYADGWPYGLAPELLAPPVPGILAGISGGDDGPVERDALFSLIQKDINAFDIETEISPVDLRCHRLNLCADSKRNLLLLRRFAQAGEGIPDTAGVERIIAEQPVLLRTLPAFYPVQVYGGCPQSCALCPYPAASCAAGKGAVTERHDCMDAGRFETLLDKIIAFSGDAVIDLSLWGELALHPQKMDFISMVLARPALALVIETAGIGWKAEELRRCAELACERQSRPGGGNNSLPPLSWIVSLDSAEPERYKALRGAGFAQALDCAKMLFSLFPKDAYVQAVRTLGAEDDIERFYRFWKEAAPSGASNIIIQKYDDFCGALERRQASDLSPVIRRPCWHLMRDMPVLQDGTVPCCREMLLPGQVLGNVFSDTLESIWEKNSALYIEQCGKNYNGVCSGCDEYYTYNF